MLDNKNQIHRFWSWFEKNSSSLHSGSYSEEVLAEFDSKVSNLGLSWEIGPGANDENSLTISPNGDPEKCELAKHIVQLAPTIKGWDLYYFKQPKQNWHRLELPSDGINLSAENWEYVLLRYKDGKKEILVKADTLDDVDPECKTGIVEIVLTNLIGEEDMIKEIDFIDILSEDENQYELSHLKYLKEHLELIKNGA